MHHGLGRFTKGEESLQTTFAKPPATAANAIRCLLQAYAMKKALPPEDCERSGRSKLLCYERT
jgi:hypothetical protein